MELNPAQKKAVSHYQGPCMVLAGPGSGKTLTIAMRIANLIQEYQVRPEEILVITFTKYASYEMKQRFLSVMGGRSLPVTFGTFHGIYYGILKWAYRFEASNIFKEEERYDLVRHILRQPGLDAKDEPEDEREYIKDILNEIGKVKNHRLNIEKYESAEHGNAFRDIYRMYEQNRKQMRKIDFDDMLVLCYELFCSRPDILAKWQERFRYILVDEFQDVNLIQYEVLKLLALPENNLFVVGDDDQSIYRFRGAKPGIMLGFGKDYKDASKIILDVNYRCAGNVVKGALRVIGHNKERYPKNLRADKNNGETVHVQEVNDTIEESKYVAGKIQELHAEGIPFHEFAVLFRTNVDGRVMAETLSGYEIPFYMKDYTNHIYSHFIARNLKSYFHLAVGCRERKYFLDIANCPKRYIGRDSMEKTQVSFEDLRRFYCDKAWMQDRIDGFEWDIKMLENKTPYAAIQYIRKKIGYDDFLKEYAAARHINIEDLLQIVYEIEERAKEFRTLEEWFAYVEHYEAAQKEQGQQKGGEAVALMTMHSAKGLEFDTVFLIGSNEGVIPYKKARLDAEIEEERRMFYVAMTRAKRKLIVSYVKTKNGKELAPSRFVEELLS